MKFRSLFLRLAEMANATRAPHQRAQRTHCPCPSAVPSLDASLANGPFSTDRNAETRNPQPEEVSP